MIGTFHGDHKRFPLYNFETLRICIEHIAPDLLIIEEDPKTYAQKWYEKLSLEEYASKRPVEVRTVLLPYAKEKNIKVVPVDDRAAYDAHEAPSTSEYKRALIGLTKAYQSLFVDDYLKKSIYDFQSDLFMAVIEQYQEQQRLDPLTREGQAIADRRQDSINANIVAALSKEHFKRALIVYGVTHRPSIVRAIRKAGVARLISLEEAMKSKMPSFFEREPDSSLIVR